MLELENKLNFFRAKVTRVVDGDTFDADIDQGLDTTRHERIRVKGINSPERGKNKYQEAKDKAEQLLMKEFNHIYIRTKKKDSFGRWLGEVILPSGLKFAQIMIDVGLATEYEKR